MIPISVYLIFIHLYALFWGIHRAVEAQPVPVYLISSRGWRGVLWAILWSITFWGIYIIPAVYVFAHRTRS